ncbi:uncharacterized protein QYS62_002921 [Fusarium acuminatum]|uniref:Uncharacterized protein n=1 Tax=Fusarium acuminatum TaxID=5515 RepID=A0ABZ2WNW5_9HYPO
MIFPPFVSSLDEVYSVEMASGNPSSSDASEISEQVMAAGFPQTMHLTWTQSTSTMALFLSDESSQTLYAALMPRGWQGPTYLFPGTTFVGDAISSSNRSGNDFVFQLPSVPSYQISPDEITMSYHRSRSNPRYTFSIKVEGEGGRRTEAFEWLVSGETQNSAYSMDARANLALIDQEAVMLLQWFMRRISLECHRLRRKLGGFSFLGGRSRLIWDITGLL